MNGLNIKVIREMTTQIGLFLFSVGMGDERL